MLWEHEPQASVSTAFSSSPNFHECFYNSIETRRTCFLFLLENNATKKRKKELGERAVLWEHEPQATASSSSPKLSRVFL